MVCGDVDHCTEKLAALIEEYGFNELLCWTRIGGLDTRKVLRSMELMSGLVMPRVRRATEQLAA
jgi:alkanesulfonate monooxygenase SsuD/methylene tetrahydromethanopterin reductase-like flavin-dependent oxidoreductase (luciferase family)